MMWYNMIECVCLCVSVSIIKETLQGASGEFGSNTREVPVSMRQQEACETWSRKLGVV